MLGEKEYYEKQFATLESFEEVDALTDSAAEDLILEDEGQVQAERAMKISNFANVLLLAFKVSFPKFYFSFFFSYLANCVS